MQANWFSIDEGVNIHESSAGTSLRDGIGTSDALYCASVVSAVVAAGIKALDSDRFELARANSTRLFFALSAAIFIGGWYVDQHPDAALAYATLTSSERFLEMCGVGLLIAGLLDYARHACNVPRSSGTGNM